VCVLTRLCAPLHESSHEFVPRCPGPTHRATPRQRRQLAPGHALSCRTAAQARKNTPPPRHASLIAAPVRGLTCGRRSEDARLPSTTSLISASSAALPARLCVVTRPAAKARHHASAGNAPPARRKHLKMGKSTHGPRKSASYNQARAIHTGSGRPSDVVSLAASDRRPATAISDPVRRATIPACHACLLSPVDRGATSPGTA
jgi:hypothetical protein